MTTDKQQFRRRHIDLSSGVTLHVARAGTVGAPRIVLLHGWPETWYTWRKIVPYLDDFDLVMPDLRGLGDSSIPEAGYDKHTMAQDIVLLLNTLEACPAETIIVGHDIGGAVAVFVADLMRDSVAGLVVLDAGVPHTPSQAVPSNPDPKRWHHTFHKTALLPEQLIDGREEVYYGWFWDNFGADSFFIDTETRTQYLRSYSNPARTRAGLAMYRSAPADDSSGDGLLAHPLPMPVLAIGGAEGFGRGGGPMENLRHFAMKVSGGMVEGAGHWLPEEAPEEIARLIRDFTDLIGAVSRA